MITRRPNADKNIRRAGRRPGTPKPFPTRRWVLAKIERSLRELPFDEADIAALVPGVLNASFLLKPGSRLNPQSTFFDFRRKIGVLVKHFVRDGLTLPDYVQAVARRPQLLCMAPATIQSNVESITRHFARHGLSREDYLRRASSSPLSSTRRRPPFSPISSW